MQAGYPEVVSSEIAKIRGADGVRRTGRQHDGARPPKRGLAESKTPSMHGNFTHENRETPLPSAAAKRHREVESEGHEEKYRAVIDGGYLYDEPSAKGG
jgi:hypothetical protein